MQAMVTILSGLKFHRSGKTSKEAFVVGLKVVFIVKVVGKEDIWALYSIGIGTSGGSDNPISNLWTNVNSILFDCFSSVTKQ